ncbi:hypothetical protein [Dyella choica]|uniref:Uncharacterized protein n=1 Tax=Dyella choica TaxID=1927959 RepID=A0A432M801_9GAMM|nr:hypothetical protein [Dyella choica]RUL77575.1 hypothetical protein EKH80_06760 [Dyella choica]
MSTPQIYPIFWCQSIFLGFPCSKQNPCIQTSGLPYYDSYADPQYSIPISGSISGIANPDNYVLGLWVYTGTDWFMMDWTGNAATHSQAIGADGSWSLLGNRCGTNFALVLMTQGFWQNNLATYNENRISAYPSPNGKDEDVVLSCEYPIGYNANVNVYVYDTQSPGFFNGPTLMANGQCWQAPDYPSEIWPISYAPGYEDPTSIGNNASAKQSLFVNWPYPALILAGLDQSGNETGWQIKIGLYGSDANNSGVYFIMAAGFYDKSNPNWEPGLNSVPTIDCTFLGNYNSSNKKGNYDYQVAANLSFGLFPQMLMTQIDAGNVSSDVFKELSSKSGGIWKDLLKSLFKSLESAVEDAAEAALA